MDLLFKNYNVRKSGEFTTFYEINEKNKKGESLTIEVCEVYPNNESGSSLPNLWLKHGYTNKLYNSYLYISTYVDDLDGNCWGKYNITAKLSEDKKRMVIDFDYLLEVNEKNKVYLLNKIYKKFMEA